MSTHTSSSQQQARESAPDTHDARTPPRVVVVGTGYAGTATVSRLQQLREPLELVWISREDYHFVLHESHRLIRHPEAAETLTVPVSEIIDDGTQFVQGDVVSIDASDRVVVLADGTDVGYDYLVVATGSETAFYGLPGLAEHAYTLKSRADALAIHEAVADVVRNATPDDPARVVVGGGGLTGVQVAGELAAFRDRHRAALDVTLVEALDQLLPGEDATLARRVARLLDRNGVTVATGRPVTGADDGTLFLEGADPLPYDVLVWTGGITGQPVLADGGLGTERDRLRTTPTLQTTDDRVFALGDAAFVDVDGDVVPQTAQAAWQAGSLAAENVISAVRGESLAPFRYRDRGTVLSVGDAALGVRVGGFSGATVTGRAAAVLKKGIAARWLAKVASPGRALNAWSYL